MLTVQKLIDYLKTQDPNACILGFEINSNAYIEQFPDLPNRYIQTVKQEKIDEREWLMNVYRDIDPKTVGCKTVEEYVDKKIDEIFRYTEDTDIVLNVGNC